MHVPDGFLDVPTSLATAAVATVGVAAALRGARRDLDERTTPIAGLVAVFVFAGQMITFPVGAGTSGHLLGGTLAAVLAGPWLATLALAVVLIVQAFLFADGGITALGTNVVLMGLVGVWAGWFAFRVVRTLLRRSSASITVAAAVGAFVSVPVTAATFVALFAIGGQVQIPVGSVLAAMLSWHVLIGLGEALITALVVGSVMAVRPDLVAGARGVGSGQPLEIRQGASA
ncbi:energy-coupling factor ABC transporter permease [Intrasporangium sp. DVR]|uniref:energy-coupling factor ABC transporter permease n=1 Tax=Intrasporangium sp. DVR TaxID=3127867 RepID=UPI00313A50B9